MKIKTHISIHRLIAKIDNDFNISESDWIPRVAAWVIDALSQMQVLPMERKKRTLDVKEKIAIFPCTINATEMKVYDKNGCEIPNLNSNNICCRSTPVKGMNQSIAIFDSSNKSGINYMQVGNVVDNTNRNYVLDGNNIELNFDTDQIIVETYEIATYYDEYYDCDIPYIYDNGLLLEALAWYVLFKYLSRGSTHPVYSISDTNQITNPYYQWTILKPKAMASVKIAISKDSNGWNNFFYNSTFLPR